MAVHASHAALPYPIKGARFSLLLPYLDADGDPTAPTTPDTEVSKDNGAAADCAEEASATSGMDGMALLTLSGAEMDASCVALNAKVASGPKATLVTLYPRVLATVGTGTLSAGSAGGGTLGTILAYDVTGCFIKTTGGTGGGGTGGTNNQARRIVTYTPSTGAFTVEPNWETTPDNTTTYAVLLPEGVTLGMLKTLNPATAGRQLVVDANGLADANTVKVGPTGSGTAQTAGDLKASLDTIDDFLDTEVAAIKAKTDNLPSDPADASDIAASFSSLQTAILAKLPSALTADGLMKSDTLRVGGTLQTAGDLAALLAAIDDYIDTEIAAIKAVTDAIGATGTGLSAIPWNAAWDAEVQSEVNDAIDTAIAELGVGAPTATPTIRTALMLLYMALRNKLVVQTSGTDAIEIHNDAGTKIASKAITDDGSDYTEAEMA